MQTEFSQSTGPTSDDGPTCEHGRNQTPSGLTLSAEGSHAKTLATPENERELTETEAACGSITLESFASFDPELSLWKTCQRCLFGGLIEFSENWPRAGTMRNGNAYRRQSLVPLIVATGYSSLPTMRVSMLHGATRKKALQRLEEMRIEDWCFLKSQRDDGIPNPTWIEWLAGFPEGWTDLDASGTS
jgi:hypothetical protein